MNLTIVIPNYNGGKYLHACIDSILQQIDYFEELIIIDNNSSDNSIDIIQSYAQNYPEIKIIQNDTNRGFSKAVNQGIRETNSPYILLLNNDIELEKDFIKTLLSCIQRDEKIFSVQGKMLQYHNRTLIDDAGDEYNLLGWAYKRGDGKAKNEYCKTEEIFSTCAGAAIYRKTILDQIGYFDEKFFAYMEDIDIGYRARIHGYINMYCPEAIVYHIGSATTGSKYNDFKVTLAARNNIYVSYKNMPIIQLIINTPFLIIGTLIKWLFFKTKGLGKTYTLGLKEGIKTLNNIEKISFKCKNFWQYIKIEGLLIKNTFTYLIHRIIKK